MSTKTLNLTEPVYQYILNHSLREPKILAQLREETARLPNAQMQISPEQGQFMSFLIKLIAAKKTLEIGVFTGYSAMAVALALPADGKVIACDINKEWTDIAQQFWQRAGVQNKIELHLAPALDTLEELIQAGQSNSFDFVFIDADKKGYDAYYEKSLQLLRRGGLMMLDNVLQRGRVADLNSNDGDAVAIRELNEKLLKDERIFLSMLPLSDGVTLVYKN